MANKLLFKLILIVVLGTASIIALSRFLVLPKSLFLLVILGTAMAVSLMVIFAMAKRFISLIILGIILIVCFVVIFNVMGRGNQDCQQIVTLAKNTATGKCRYFLSRCIDKGYITASESECDCDALDFQDIPDPSIQQYFTESCKRKQSGQASSIK
ncbi:hypothetical protein KY366_00675 [Candidatus Woesearchaeota archaeon]|nr:hypothetical protein [Candidatus Woesearchaeota archaeon]